MNRKNLFSKLTRNNCFFLQLLAAGALTLFSAFTISGVFLLKDALFNDKLRFYSYFYDILHSLNYYGEIPWWNPAAQNGFPSYYTALLGLNYTNPLFAVIAFTVWAMGFAGLVIPSFVKLHVVYFGVLVPALYMVSLLLFTRQIVRNNLAALFVLILGSFAPGMVVNVLGIGFEETTYGLLFLAAFMQYVRKPGEKSFWPLSFSALLLAVSINYPFLFWNVIFVPVFIALFVVAARKKVPVSPVPRRYWAILAAGVLICVLPTILTYTQGADTVRRPMNTRVYEYYRLPPGNPLPFISVSIPALVHKGTCPVSYDSVNLTDLTYFYNYLGLLALPLVFIGFVFGRRPWRTVFLYLFGISALIVCLSGYSPLFSLLLAQKTPLRAVSHFGDLFFTLGGYHILIFAAALGLEALIRYRATRVFAPALGGAAVSILVSLFLAAKRYADPYASYIFGFAAVVAFAYVLLLAILYRAKNKNALPVFRLLLILLLIDVSSSVFFFMRERLWFPMYFSNLTGLSDPPVNSVGLPPLDPRTGYSHLYLGLTGTLRMEALNLELNRLPLAGEWAPEIAAGINTGKEFRNETPAYAFSGNSRPLPIKLHFRRFGTGKKTDIAYYDDNLDLWTIKSAKGVRALPEKALSTGREFVTQWGDLNGDGRDDVLLLDEKGNLSAAFYLDPKFSPPRQVVSLHSFFDRLLPAADVDGDGKDEPLYCNIKTLTVHAIFSRSGLYKTREVFRFGGEFTEHIVFKKYLPEIRFADFNGDRKADMAFIDGAGRIQVALSNGVSFTEPAVWYETAGISPENIRYSDIDGDKKADCVILTPEGTVKTAIAGGTKFLETAQWGRAAVPSTAKIDIADMDGDGKNDLVLSSLVKKTPGVAVARQTYNELVITSRSASPRLIVVRDAFSPYWRCAVNGKKAEIKKVFLGLKGIEIPAGVSEIRLIFRPFFIPTALAFAYLCVMIAGVIALARSSAKPK